MCHNTVMDLTGVFRPGDLGFGNPHKIKEHKLHKMPPYLVFNAQRSSMYPEIYISMGFKRGSQNRNHFTRIKQDCSYTPRAEKKRVMKKLEKMARKVEKGASPSPILSTEVSTVKRPTQKQGAKAVANQVANGRKKRSAKKSKKETLPLTSSGDHHDTGVDLDNNFDNVIDLMPLDGKSDSLNGAASSDEVTTAKNPPLPSTGDPHDTGVDLDNNFDNVIDPMPLDGQSDSLNGAALSDEVSDHHDTVVDLDNNFENVIDPMPLDGQSDSLNSAALSDEVTTAKNPPLPSTGDHHDTGVDLDNNFDNVIDPMPLDGQSDSLNGAALSDEVTTAKKPAQKQDAKPVANQVTKKRKKRSATENKKETPDLDLPSSDVPPLPSNGNHHDMDVDFDNGFDKVTDPMPFDRQSDSLNGAIGTVNRSTAASHSRNKRRRKGISISKTKSCVVIDTQVLAAECEAGRYPSINRYHGEHETQCALCKQPGDTPLLNCDFCKNSVHQLCLDKNMLQKDPQVIIRENEPDDTPMCNKCISTCLFRRWRAENRRLTKWQHELAKAGLGSVPEAASLREEVNLNKIHGSNDDLEMGGSGEDDKLTYESCPDGGPGGLICCSYCTAAYSRFLSNTAKEMEAQTVSKVGQEVSEILELLEDAKQRLQRATYVSQSNEERRGILDQNQTAHGGVSFTY
jgi:hypothetical protein